MELAKCYLCASALLSCSKPSAWPTETQQWVDSMCSRPIPLGVVVCCACEKFIKRNTGKRIIIVPCWLPKEAKTHCSYCMVEGCGEVYHTKTSFVSYEVAQQHLDLSDASHSENASSTALALRNSHYQQLYREINFPQLCAACSSQPRYGGGYTRRCPHPEKITEFLQQNFNFGGALTCESKICKPCYTFHHYIHQQLNDRTSSSDHTLESIQSELDAKIRNFKTKEKNL